MEEADLSFVYDELGKLYQSKGQLDAAAEAPKQSVDIETRVKGEDHRDVAASTHSLPGALKAQGDLPAARAHLERVLAIDEQVYGTRDHYSTAMTEVSLAILLQQPRNPNKPPSSWPMPTPSTWPSWVPSIPTPANSPHFSNSKQANDSY